MVEMVKQFWSEEDGVTAIEYGLGEVLHDAGSVGSNC